MIIPTATDPTTVAAENRQKHLIESSRLVSVLRGTGNRKAYMRPITKAIVKNIKTTLAQRF